MRVEVRSRDKTHKLNRSLINSVEQLFQKLDRYVGDPAYIEITLEHLHSRRKGGTHYAHGSATIPGEPTTFHTQALAEDFRTASDKVYSKMERHLRQRHTKLTRTRLGASRRAKIDRWIHDSLHAPQRLLLNLRPRRYRPGK
jgi:ribosome-associated translation inhibitor RaiA